MKEILIEGIVIRFNERGAVMWCSQWARLHKLNPKYLMIKVYKQLYGHLDYIVRPQYR